MFMKFKVLTYQIDVVVFSTHNSLLLNRQDFSAVDSAMFYQPDYQGERSLGLDGRPFPSYFVPLFQNECQRKTLIYVKTNL